MSRVLHRLSEEPAALGALVASFLPVLVIADAVRLDEQEMAAIVVFVNALVAFCVRLFVTPTSKQAANVAVADEHRAAVGGTSG